MSGERAWNHTENHLESGVESSEPEMDPQQHIFQSKLLSI